MTVRQLIPEGLAQMAPGPLLNAVLADLDIRALTGSDLLEVLQARARQLSHNQAQLLAVMAEIGRCDPAAGPDKVVRLPEPSGPEESLVSPADEIRAALAWTRHAACREYGFALSLQGRLPAVFAALNDGVICRSKAWLFSELCAPLTDEQAQAVCARLLPKAGRLTTGELAARIKKLAIALDPEWAARRYASAVRDRDVIGYLDEEGTATVSGRRLPADQAAAACARIEDLARAAKRAGYPGRIGPLRADIYVGLLDGRWTHHTREEIITDLLARTAAAAHPPLRATPHLTPLPTMALPPARQPSTLSTVTWWPTVTPAWSLRLRLPQSARRGRMVRNGPPRDLGWGWSCGSGCAPCSDAGDEDGPIMYRPPPPPEPAPHRHRQTPTNRRPSRPRSVRAAGRSLLSAAVVNAMAPSSPSVNR